MRLLVATQSRIVIVDPEAGTAREARGPDGHHPTCLAADPWVAGRAWCGTARAGVYRSDDAGESWSPSGLEAQRLMSLTASPAEAGVVWAGTEPSQVWRSHDGGASWARTSDLAALPSSGSWAFPPRPETHHVRWIACHPREAGRLWVAIEAGALVTTADGGRSWRDRVAGGPYDTHELAVHPQAPETLRVAAGDGYFESFDGGATWARPHAGLDVGYLRSVTVDPGRPEVVLVSAASTPRRAYVAGSADGRVYRREGEGRWERVVGGWPDPPGTIAPLLLAGRAAGELWAADERGVHRSADGGRRWERVAGFPETPRNLRGAVTLASGD